MNRKVIIFPLLAVVIGIWHIALLVLFFEQEARTMNSVNGSSFQMGNFDQEYVRQLSEPEIE